MLENQDSRLLAIKGKDLSDERIVEEDSHDEISNDQVTDVQTTYRDTISVQMFNDYQTRRNTSNMRICLFST